MKLCNKKHQTIVFDAVSEFIKKKRAEIICKHMREMGLELSKHNLYGFNCSCEQCREAK